MSGVTGVTDAIIKNETPYYNDLFIRIIRDNKYSVFIDLIKSNKISWFSLYSEEIYYETIKKYHKNPKFFEYINTHNYKHISIKGMNTALELAIENKCMDVITIIHNKEPLSMNSEQLGKIINIAGIDKDNNEELKIIISNKYLLLNEECFVNLIKTENIDIIKYIINEVPYIPHVMGRAYTNKWNYGNSANTFILFLYTAIDDNNFYVIEKLIESCGGYFVTQDLVEYSEQKQSREIFIYLSTVRNIHHHKESKVSKEKDCEGNEIVLCDSNCKGNCQEGSSNEKEYEIEIVDKDRDLHPEASKEKENINKVEYKSYEMKFKIKEFDSFHDCIGRKSFNIDIDSTSNMESICNKIINYIKSDRI